IHVNAATLPNADLPTDPLMPDLEDTADTRIFSGAYDDEVEGAEADFNNLELTIFVSPIPTTRSHKDHPKEKIIGDPLLALKTRRMTRTSQEHDMMDVKSAFLYGTIEEEVYVCQPLGFEDPHFSDKVYKVEKALYGLLQAPRASYETLSIYLLENRFRRWIIDKTLFIKKDKDPHFSDKVYKVEKALYGLLQAPRASYETLSIYLLENRFRRGIIDKTLFIKKDKGDILLVQVYVDDIIFGSTKKSLGTEFEGLMHKKFQMSFIGELTFFLGLQVMQKDDGIFISQDKYVADILKKFDFSSVKIESTPIKTNKALLKDEEAEDMDRIFRYLKGQPKLGLWYPRDSPFNLEAFYDSDYTGASLDLKSTTGEYVAAANYYGHVLWIQNQTDDRYGLEMALVMNLELKLVVAKVSTA
nr:hypothetical protein [Tanacetum cinerariifolium]